MTKEPLHVSGTEIMSFISELNAKKQRDPALWYSEVGGLIATAPDLSTTPLSDSALIWLGKVNALLEEMGQHMLAYDFKRALEDPAGTRLHKPAIHAEKMRTALYLALGIAERKAPLSSKGAFIPVGAAHDALIAISPVLNESAKDILIIDPYLSQVVLNDFALSINEGVTLRLLSGKRNTNPDLEPALRAWRQQHTPRPVDVRLADQVLLHDRLIIPDGTAWSLSKSFDGLAKNSPATLQPFDHEIGRAKTAYYESIWSDAAPM